ncbi:MAG: type II secretion system F family protein, partial [Acidimicrobiia bacterium]
MPKFAYSAIDSTGAEIEGTTKADTIGTARSILVEQNLFPIRIEEARGLLDFELSKEKVKKKNLMNFTRQLSVFVRAGIPITEALTTIGDETTDVALRRAIVTMVDDLRNGGLLSAAAAQHPQVFPNYYIGILQAAELTGRLDESLDSLAGYLKREIETRSKVVSALAYPVIVMGLAVVTVMVLAGYVLPQFTPLFESLDAELPATTRFMLFIARFFGDLWYITVITWLIIFAFLGFLIMHPTGKEIWQRMVLKIPIIGGIVEYAILERFTSVLGTMLQAGVAVPSAMETTIEAVSNVVYREQLEIARQQ